MIKVFVVSLAAAAFVLDLVKGKVSNVLIAAGLLCGFCLKSERAVRLAVSSGTWSLAAASAGLWLAGAALPMLSGWLLFRFRMIGAGDIKLLMAIGGVLGPRSCIRFMVISVVCGAVISIPLMIGVTGIGNRIAYLRGYFRKLCATGVITPYRKDPSAEFHFTAAILMAALLYASGLLY